MYLSLYCKGSKRVTQGLRVRGSWRPNRNCNILTPLIWPSALCLSCSPDAQPEALGPILLRDGFLYFILSATSLDPNSIRGPEPLRPGVAFPTTLVYNSVRSLTVWLLSWLSYIIVQRPLDLWNRMFHRHQAEITDAPEESDLWTASSHVTLFRCISLWVYHGNLLPRPISSANFSPRDFLS